ncbi:serine/threonine-protein kinase TTK/MPS1 [Enteropsectra breve]|nr:serine/threonine-protein kinase TTK/MPS1 [Enteropsectra breve]
MDNLPSNTKDLMEHLKTISSSNPQTLLSAYTNALPLLQSDSYSLAIFIDYISLAKNSNDPEEMEHIFALFKVKLRAYKAFWNEYVAYEMEYRGKSPETVFKKALDYLRVKIFPERDGLIEQLQKDKIKFLMLDKNNHEEPYDIRDGREDRDDKMSVINENKIKSPETKNQFNRDIHQLNIHSQNSLYNYGAIATCISTPDIHQTENILYSTNSLSSIEREIDKILEKENDVHNEPDDKESAINNPQIRSVRKNVIEDNNTNVKRSPLSKEASLSSSFDSSLLNTSAHSYDSNKFDTNKFDSNKFNTNANRNSKDSSLIVISCEPESQDDKENHKNTNFTKPLRFSPKRQAPYNKFQNTSDLELPLIPGTQEESQHMNIENRKIVEEEISLNILENTQKINSPKIVKFKNYEMLKLGIVAKGGNALVYKVVVGNEVYALKEMKIEHDYSDSSDNAINKYMDEVIILEKLKKFDFIIKMIDYSVEKYKIGILLEYAEFDLQTLIKRGSMSVFMIKFVWESILKILEGIHSERIVHKDIKPGNFVFVRGMLKLIDFGISKRINKDTTSVLNIEKTGTMNYISPEQCMGLKVGRSSDIWSAGCILYNMIYRKNIHRGTSIVDLVRAMNEESEIEYGPADPLAVEAMKMCLVYDPKKRGSLTSLLEHSFLKK